MKNDSAGETDGPSRDPLETFGLDTAGDQWLERLRSAERGGGSTRVGAYRLLESHAGGQGVVYRATRDDGGVDVALKRLSHGVFATAAMRRRFEREIEAALELRHPNIAPVRDVMEIDGHVVLAMEWIDGLPLDRHVAEHIHDRDPHRVVPLFLELCDAVVHAHQNGVLHRDLKPSNVIVDREGHPRLIDFGLARRIVREGASVTRDGAFVGTPAYAAPEQLAGRGDSDVRGDEYALGRMLFELLAGALPARPDRERKLLSQTRRGIDRDLDGIVDQALRESPLDRYASVSALADDLRRWLRGEPIAADALSTAVRWRRAARRHRTLLAIALPLLAAAAAYASIEALNRRRLEQEERKLTAALEQVCESRDQAITTMVFFIHDILDRADPLHSKHGFTVRDALDVTEKRLANLEAVRPMSRLVLHESLAYLFATLDELERAEQHARAALAVDAEIHGEEPPHLLARRSALARLLVRMDRVAEAEPLFVGMEDWAKHEDGPLTNLSISLLETLARRDRATGEPERAAERLERARFLWRKLTGKDIPWYDPMLLELVRAYADAGRPADALPILDAALSAEATGDIAPDHPRARLQFLLAHVQRLRGDLDAAQAAIDAALSVLRVRLPALHTDIAEAELEHAAILAARGAREEAKRIAQSVAERLNPNRRDARRSLAELLAGD